MIDFNEKTLMVAERGCIYDFVESDGTIKNQVLVVSSPRRARDRMVSILMIGDAGMGYDVVTVNYNGQKRFVHCGLTTYCARNRLGRKVCQVSAKTMEAVDMTMASEMGLIPERAMVYKEMYEALLDRVAGVTA
jgi:hypothetical protein